MPTPELFPKQGCTEALVVTNLPLDTEEPPEKQDRSFLCLLSLQLHSTLENWSSTDAKYEAEHVSASFVWLLVPNLSFPVLPARHTPPQSN